MSQKEEEIETEKDSGEWFSLDDNDELVPTPPSLKRTAYTHNPSRKKHCKESGKG